MADISKITLPSGSEYNLKDATARADIESLKGSVTGAMHYLGVTTTAITDGSSTNPISVGGKSVTAKAGDVAISGSKEFVYSDTDNKWHEYGDTGSLKALAFKDEASGDFTPSGTVSKPTFTGTESNVTITVAASASGNYTPEGTVTPTVTLNSTTVNSITDVGTLPSCTMPILTTTVANENLTIGWTDGTFAAGTLPTKGADVSVATGVKTVTATFTGTKVNITGKTTATGEVSQPTFTGTTDTVTVS